jgi:hypothetical protein
MNVAAVFGTLGSGGAKAFKEQVATDVQAIRSLGAAFTTDDEGYAALTYSELEARLTVMHRLKQTVARYADTYNAALAKDEKDRDYLCSQWKT